MTTGPPTISARNTVRRDQSISPSERSNTRSDDGRSSDGMRDVVGGRGSARVASSGPSRHFTRYWKTACRLSSGDVTSSTAPASP